VNNDVKIIDLLLQEKSPGPMKYLENKTLEKSVLYKSYRVSKTSYFLSFNNTQIILENF